MFEVAVLGLNWLPSDCLPGDGLPDDRLPDYTSTRSTGDWTTPAERVDV